MATMLEAALAYAAMGWPVFPCSPDNKAPLVEGGFKKASTDVNLIKGWWRKWPKALIAVPTGEKMGAFIVDLDLGSPPLTTGEEYFKAFFDYVGGFEHTAMAESASGGRHIYFKWNPDKPVGRVIRACPALAIDKYAKDELDDQGKRKKNAGVDCLGNDGYAIVPPSCLNDGRSWSWLHDVADGIAEANAKVMEIATAEDRNKGKARKRQALPPLTGMPAQTQVDKFAQAALDKEINELRGAVPGSRNVTLNRVAYNLGQLVGAGALAELAVWRALEDAANACGLIKDDGYPSFEATARSGLEGGKRKPRSLGHVGARRRRAAAPPRVDENARPSQQKSEADGAKSADPVDSGAGQGGNGQGGGQSGGGEDEPDPSLVQMCAGFDQNDKGNVRRLGVYFGSDMLSVLEVGEHVWAGTHWEREGAKEAWVRFADAVAAYIKLEDRYIVLSKDENDLVERAKKYGDLWDDNALAALEDQAEAAKAAAIRRKARALLDALDKRITARRKFAISSGNTAKTNSMLEKFAAYKFRTPDDMDKEPLAINVRNYTLRAEKIPDVEDPSKKVWDIVRHDHNRDDHITKMIDVDYDRSATCPKFMAFLERVQPDQAMRRFLQQFHGYSLTGLVGEQAFVFNYGSGANGKTTFIETIGELMGNYASLLPAEAVSGDMQRRGSDATPEFARLPGIRLVRIAELARGQGLREHTIKLLTGGDTMMVRHLHKGFFDFKPVFKAVASGNDRPSIGGVDEGIWRRVKLVPWEQFIPPKERKPMKKMLAEFKKEWAGILNWLLAGLIDYLSNGLVIPDAIQDATESYRKDMDPVGGFIAACVRPQDDGRVTARTMFKSYEAWCHANAVKSFSEKWFAGAMHTKGYKKTEGRIREYLNVELVDVPEDPDANKGGQQGNVYN